MWKPTVSSAVIASVAFSIASGVSANPQPLNQEGPIFFTPTLSVSQGYDDNIGESPDGDETSSRVTRVSPSFLFQAQDGANRYQFRYRPRLSYTSHDSQRTVNHNARLNSRLVFDSSNRLSLSASATRREEDSATTAPDLDGDINERLDLSGTYQFGASGAQGQLRLNAGYLFNRYTNNLDVGSERRFDEFDQGRVGATFLWRVAPRTRALVEGRYSETYYRDSESDLDGSTVSALVGAEWTAPVLARGSVRVGRTERSFDDSDKSSVSRTAVELGLDFTADPNILSNIDVTISRRFRDGRAAGDTGRESDRTRVETLYRIAWSRPWTGRLSTNLSYTLREQDFIGGTRDGRKDETTLVSLGVGYQFRRWLDFGFTARFKDRDSNEADDFDRNTFFLRANISL